MAVLVVVVAVPCPNGPQQAHQGCSAALSYYYSPPLVDSSKNKMSAIRQYSWVKTTVEQHRGLGCDCEYHVPVKNGANTSDPPNPPSLPP